MQGIAANSTNGESGLYVSYVSLDANQPGPRLRIRRLAEFTGRVVVDGVEMERFEYVGDIEGNGIS